MNEFSANGAFTFWSLKTAPHHSLSQLFNAVGFKDYTPSQRSPKRSLELATQALANYLNHLQSINYHTVIKRKGHPIFDIINIRNQRSSVRVMSSADVVPLLSTHLREYHPGKFVPKITMHSLPLKADHQTCQNRMDSEFQIHSNQVATQALASSVVAILTKELEGISVRPNGAVYWIPNRFISKWKDFTRELINRFYCQFYTCSVKHDDDLVELVAKGITNEITTATANIIDDAKSGELGERALKSKEKAAAQLLNRIQIFEQHLNTPLNELKEATKVAKRVVVTALFEAQNQI